MSTSNFTTGKAIAQNAVMADFLTESAVNNDGLDLQYSGNTPEFYQWLDSLVSQYINPNILDIFSSQDPSFGSYYRKLGYKVQITDASRSNLDFLKKLPDSDIEYPAKFFDLLTEEISKEYQLIIWHNPEVELTLVNLTSCLIKISSSLSQGTLLITNINCPQHVTQQFANQLILQPNLAFKKGNTQFQVYKKL